MDEKGFTLIEVLLSLLLLTIISITCLPILTMSLNNLMLSKEKTEMIYIAESIIEQIKSFDCNSNIKGEKLFDMEAEDLMNRLINQSSVTIILPNDIENKNFKYMCTICKKDNTENLWEIQVYITMPKEKGKMTDVNITAFIPKPQKLLDSK